MYLHTHTCVPMHLRTFTPVHVFAHMYKCTRTPMHTHAVAHMGKAAPISSRKHSLLLLFSYGISNDNPPAPRAFPHTSCEHSFASWLGEREENGKVYMSLSSVPQRIADVDVRPTSWSAEYGHTWFCIHRGMKMPYLGWERYPIHGITSFLLSKILTLKFIDAQNRTVCVAQGHVLLRDQRRAWCDSHLNLRPSPQGFSQGLHTDS